MPHLGPAAPYHTISGSISSIPSNTWGQQHLGSIVWGQDSQVEPGARARNSTEEDTESCTEWDTTPQDIGGHQRHYSPYYLQRRPEASRQDQGKLHHLVPLPPDGKDALPPPTVGDYRAAQLGPGGSWLGSPKAGGEDPPPTLQRRQGRPATPCPGAELLHRGQVVTLRTHRGGDAAS